MATETPTRRLADLLLEDTDLETFVTARRQQDPPRAWRRISRDLYEATGLDVTHETLRGWFPEADEVDTERAAS